MDHEQQMTHKSDHT